MPNTPEFPGGSDSLGTCNTRVTGSHCIRGPTTQGPDYLGQRKGRVPGISEDVVGLID